MEGIVNTAKRLLVMVLLLCMTFSALSAQDADDILLADVPIAYGDARFRERIFERTQGERSAVGLVLSGGSARAFAHIGVLKYLEEQGIVPDFIISNSMGSIVGLLYAAGLSPDQILESITSVSIQSLFDLTLPLRGGMLDSSRFIAKVSSLLGEDIQLENLPIPIIVIAEDMVTKRQILISEGDFSTVLRASYALPVYFQPVEFRGHLLLDGGVTNLVPVDLASSYADSLIISTTFYDVDTLNLRNPLTILNVSVDIGKRRQGVEELKRSLPEAIWIRNMVEDVSFMEFSKVEYLAQKGYESAALQSEALAELPKLKDSYVLDELRAKLGQQLEASSDAYRLFEQVPLTRDSHLLGIGFDSDFGTDDVSLLKDDTTLGLKYLYRTGNLSVGVNTGYSFNFVSNDQFSAEPAVRAQVDYVFLKYLRARGSVSYVHDIAANAPMLSLGAVLEGRMYFFEDLLRLSLTNSVEHLSDFKDSTHLNFYDGNLYLYHARLQARLTPEGTNTWHFPTSSFSVSYQVLGDYSVSRSFLGTRLETELADGRTCLFGTLKTFNRFALDGKGDVPFFFADGFRTTSSTIKAQGHDLSVAVNPANHLVGLQMSFGYKPVSFSPTMAELLLFKNSSVAIYTDLLWNEKSFEPALSLGLELSTDISLLGIRTLPLTVYGGWDQKVNTFVWGFWFNVAF
ncbi:MAG: patatin [Spirochaetia bacterium]|nr:patatin [Spirochaetia bacterium]